MIQHVVIIYNPNSTGDGQTNAEELAKKLRDKNMKVTLEATQHAGHAKRLARDYANKNKRTLIISSSGDGGYHEVVNGVLKSNNPTTPVGVLPSGNANDHYHFTHRGNLVSRILRDDRDTIDVLKLTRRGATYYAHSYIGLGVTPQIGKELTRAKLNPFNEAWLVISNLFKIHPVKIRVGRKRRRYDSLVFANIGRMSKFLTISDKTDPRDGKFEIVTQRSRGVWALIGHLFRGAASNFGNTPSVECYEFTIRRATDIQLDGEIIRCRRGDRMVVTAEKQLLSTII